MEGFEEHYTRLKDHLRSMGSVLIAYSGGVDSTFLLKAAVDSGVDYLAVTAISPTMPEADRKSARELAAEMGARHKIVESTELSDENFVKNPENRCFFCKSNLFTQLQDIAKETGYTTVVDGSNLDDTSDYRPGLQARDELKVRSPLIEVGLSKAMIRDMSAVLGLKTWDRPSSPCLSSRFPYGRTIDITGLAMVDRAETKLRELGFRVLRVRKDGDIARIELPVAEMARVVDEKIRAEVVSFFKELGYLYITIDLEGFQSGKLNRAVNRTTASAAG